MKSVLKGIWLSLLVIGLMAISSQSIAGIFLDEDRAIVVTARVYTLARLLSQEPERFRAEQYPVGSWSLLQQRTYFEPQLLHDLSPRTNITPALRFLKDSLRIDNIRYFIGARMEYDGIYDYGPEVYREKVPSATREELKWKARVFEAYADLRFLRRLNMRIGKQNLSWGETDVFRLLDLINPLDQSFGGFLTPLDERRVPSFMIKGILDAGSLGPVYNIALEGFVEPDPEILWGPTFPLGSPWALITGPPSALEYRLEDKEQWKDSRGGARLLTTIGDYSLSLANYWTYPEIPTPVLKFDPEKLASLAEDIPEIVAAYPAGVPYLELNYPKIMVSGASLSGPLPLFPYTILRTEFVYILDHPVFIPGENIPLLLPLLELDEEKIDDYIAQLDALQRQQSILAQGLAGVIEKRDLIRWNVGIDDNRWIRPLNPRQTFFISLQFFGEHYRELPAGAAYTLQERALVREVTLPDGSETTLAKPFFVPLPVNSYKATSLIRTGYPLRRGYLTPELTTMFDFGDFDAFTYLLQPSLNYYRDPYRFRIEYNYIEGEYSGLGFYKDRDNLMFKLDYMI